MFLSRSNNIAVVRNTTVRVLFQLLILLGLVGSSTFFGRKASAQVPREISYQGTLMDGGSLANGTHAFSIKYYDLSGAVLYTETFSNVQVSNGIFNLLLGSGQPNGFPATMTFGSEYYIARCDGFG